MTLSTILKKEAPNFFTSRPTVPAVIPGSSRPITTFMPLPCPRSVLENPMARMAATGGRAASVVFWKTSAAVE